jgi:ubiquinone/menaquinone biosynthesis C-methylase UbiE
MSRNAVSSGWQLGGNAPVAYDTYIVDAFMQDYSRRLAEAASIQKGERILDVACGTGVVTRLCAAQAGTDGHVVGIDLNPGMLARARARDAEGSEIIWHEGSATEMPFPDASFDAVLCQQGLQFIPDKAQALAEMRRVLAREGKLLVSVWRSIEHCPWQRAVADAIEARVGSEPAGLVRSAFTFGDAQKLEQLLSDAGFADTDVVIDSDTIRHPSLSDFVPGYLSATPVAAVVSNLDKDVQNQITVDVREKLAEHLVGDALAVPIEAYLATARR